MFQWGRESQLSSSVPVSVISSLPDYQVTSDNKKGAGGHGNPEKNGRVVSK